jgi:hypothetical protein
VLVTHLRDIWDLRVFSECHPKDEGLRGESQPGMTYPKVLVPRQVDRGSAR